MEVILIKDVESLGAKGEVANVSDGYARNYLFPRKLAQIATPARVAAVRKAEAEKAEKERRQEEQAEELRDILSRTVLTIPAPTGGGEKLFGSVTNADVADAIWAARKIRIDKRNVLLEEPIKMLGSYQIEVIVHHTVEPAEVKVIIVPQSEK